MTATLQHILEATQQRVGALRERRTELEVAARGARGAPAWSSAFGADEVAVIAEIKRRSPSAGIIAGDVDPASHAAAYAAGGARAISVLTEGPHFGGSLEDLELVRRVVPLPVLRKDFILDPVQLYEARVAGASAVLLIVRALDSAQLVELAAEARELGLGRLVEVHAPEELERALALEPESVGVNSRDLETLEVNVSRLRDIVRQVPQNTVAVAESGLRDRSDVERIAEWGADAVLIGTALSGAGDPESAVRSLTGVARRGRRGGRGS